MSGKRAKEPQLDMQPTGPPPEPVQAPPENEGLRSLLDKILKLSTKGFKNHVELRNTWKLNDKLRAQGGLRYCLQTSALSPQLDLLYKIGDRQRVRVSPTEVAIERMQDVGPKNAKLTLLLSAGVNTSGKFIHHIEVKSLAPPLLTVILACGAYLRGERLDTSPNVPMKTVGGSSSDGHKGNDHRTIAISARPGISISRKGSTSQLHVSKLDFIFNFHPESWWPLSEAIATDDTDAAKDDQRTRGGFRQPLACVTSATPQAPPAAKSKQLVLPRKRGQRLTAPFGYDMREVDEEYNIDDDIMALLAPEGVDDPGSDLLELTDPRPFYPVVLPPKPWPKEFEALQREQRRINLQGTSTYRPGQ